MCTISPKLVDAAAISTSRSSLGAESSLWMERPATSGLRNAPPSEVHRPSEVHPRAGTVRRPARLRSRVASTRPGPAEGCAQALPPGRAERLRDREDRGEPLQRCLPGRPARPGVHRPHPEGRLRRCAPDDQLDNPFPGSAGRICNHAAKTPATGEARRGPRHQGAQEVCDRQGLREAVPASQPAERKFDERIAVIGAGPSGWLPPGTSVCGYG